MVNLGKWCLFGSSACQTSAGQEREQKEVKGKERRERTRMGGRKKQIKYFWKGKVRNLGGEGVERKEKQVHGIEREHKEVRVETKKRKKLTKINGITENKLASKREEARKLRARREISRAGEKERNGKNFAIYIEREIKKIGKRTERVDQEKKKISMR